jgi:hypothetical protein
MANPGDKILDSGQEITGRKRFFFEKKTGRPRTKKFLDQEPWAVSLPQPMTQIREVFLLLFVHKKKRLLPQPQKTLLRQRIQLLAPRIDMRLDLRHHPLFPKAFDMGCDFLHRLGMRAVGEGAADLVGHGHQMVDAAAHSAAGAAMRRAVVLWAW